MGMAPSVMQAAQTPEQATQNGNQPAIEQSIDGEPQAPQQPQNLAEQGKYLQELQEYGQKVDEYAKTLPAQTPEQIQTNIKQIAVGLDTEIDKAIQESSWLIENIGDVQGDDFVQKEQQNIKILQGLKGDLGGITTPEQLKGVTGQLYSITH